jgi:ABC-type multidrug transport system fused ATPase/permease subunit
MEIVLIAVAVVAAIVVLYQIWVRVLIPIWDALVDAWDWTVNAYEAVVDFVKDYIIYPIKWTNKKIRRMFMTPLERVKQDRDDMAQSIDAVKMAVAMGMCDQEMVDTLEYGVEAYDEAIADKEARDAAEAEANA